MFEIFIPVELENNEDGNMDHNHEGDKDLNNLSDSFETENSLKNLKDDKFADFDINIQRKQLKKFFQL